MRSPRIVTSLQNVSESAPAENLLSSSNVPITKVNSLEQPVIVYSKSQNDKKNLISDLQNKINEKDEFSSDTQKVLVVFGSKDKERIEKSLKNHKAESEKIHICKAKKFLIIFQLKKFYQI